MNKKRVLIISKSSHEFTTERVIDWLLFLGHKYDRLNGEKLESIDNDIEINLNDLKLPNVPRLKNKYYSIWFRRWSDLPLIQNIKNYCTQNNLSLELTNNILHTVSSDLFAVKNIFVNNINCVKKLTSLNQVKVNKFDVLLSAQRFKLNTPNSLLTNNKASLLSFISKINKPVVVKDMDTPFHHTEKTSVHLNYTYLIKKRDLKNIPKHFALSFFQEQVEKRYEIRSFFLNDKFYSMAIFSQNNSLTQTDFRRYDYKNPNRNLPYNLPLNIEKKLSLLMKSLNLQTGSIDLIKGKNDKYYFLEVNPVGQFSNMTGYCNYNLEFQIANYLTS
jgi:ATP-GRASP peptide maturase of grasp-with-spasm system